MKDAPALSARLYSVERINLRLCVPNSCEQYAEIYKAGVHDALPRVRCAETIVPWLIRYRKSRVFTLIESMCRVRNVDVTSSQTTWRRFARVRAGAAMAHLVAA